MKSGPCNFSFSYEMKKFVEDLSGDSSYTKNEEGFENDQSFKFRNTKGKIILSARYFYRGESSNVKFCSPIRKDFPVPRTYEDLYALRDEVNKAISRKISK